MGDYSQDLLLKSSGPTYGLEIRYRPGGENGVLSLGFSLERTHMRFSLEGTVRQEFVDGSYGEVEADAFIDLSPLTTNLSLRWDVNPRWLVTPYFVFGLGVAPLTGNIGYSFDGVYKWSGPDETLTSSYDKTFQEAEEEIDFNLPNIFILLQMHVGIRVNIISGLILRIEGGIWDGFAYRAGLGFRF
jgi:hypothetical protein